MASKQKKEITFSLSAKCFSLSLSLLAILFIQDLRAQETPGSSSPFHLSVELTSKYMWRGIEYGTSPVVFPMLNYQSGGLYVYAMGGYAWDGSHQEVDLGISYSFHGLTLSVNDYYYPSAVGGPDHYFNMKDQETGHWLETTLQYAPSRIPIWVLLSCYLAGADKNPSGKQAYSSYAEVGGCFNFSSASQLSLAAGASINDSFYNDYTGGFCICNLQTKYTYTIQKGICQIPLSVAYIINPYRQKAFVTFSVSIAI